MANPKVGSDISYDGVKGYSEGHTETRNKNAYKSKESPGWKKIEVPDGQHYAERKRSGTDVPKPPELNLP